MKKFLVFLTMLFTISCSKDSGPTNSGQINSKIFGSWKLVSEYMSDGTQGSWQSPSRDITFTLYPDSNYVVSGYDFIGTSGKAHILNDSTLLTVFSYGAAFDFPRPLLPNVFIEDSILYMPSFICVEGCAYRFKRVKATL